VKYDGLFEILETTGIDDRDTILLQSLYFHQTVALLLSCLHGPSIILCSGSSASK